jgi:hypothetical protein
MCNFETLDSVWPNKIDRIKNTATALIPRLFKGFIVTTNFDRVLEHLYHDIPVCHPGHSGQLNRAIQHDKPTLFKLHGCISDVDNIILTQEAYDIAYPEDGTSEVMRSLKNIFTRKTLLFLGCSLQQDMTIKTWNKIIETDDGQGIEHFAIVHHYKDNANAVRRRLSNLNIRSIIYDCGTDGKNHDAVRTILQQLLSDTNTIEKVDNLPERNSYFSGRDQSLSDIDDLFNKKSANAVSICQTISGLGGIGKTQLAIEYAYQYSGQYTKAIWFVIAETSTTIYNYFRAFAEHFKLTLKPDFKPEDLQMAVKGWLSDNSDWLIVFDNLDVYDIVKPYLPNQINGRLIITTRNTSINVGTQIELGVFNLDDGIRFLKRRLSKNDELGLENYHYSELPKSDFDEQAPNLLIRLGYLPLALEQAAAYIFKVRCSITHYLLLLGESGIDALKNEYAKPNEEYSEEYYRKIVNDTWTISFNALASNEAAQQLFNLCAYMAPDKIPTAFFVEMRHKLPSPLRERLEKTESKDGVITALRDYSLVTGDVNYFNIHRLVQEVVRKSHEVGDEI